MTSQIESREASAQPVQYDRQMIVFARIAWALVILGFVAGAPGLWRLCHESGQTPNDRFSLVNLSLFGSYLQGAVSSLWSLAAFLFIYLAFLGQKQQLRFQARQIDDTRHDLEEQRGLQKRTAELLLQQAEAMSQTVRLNALIARIEAYTVQIGDFEKAHNMTLVEKLRAERRDLILKLDGVLRANGDRGP